jgi:RHS repeat-associated protein
VEVDPWGGNTARSVNSSFQPHLYTSYERDSDGGDDAMMRRYIATSTRFAQPDPYDGSVKPNDPQSFNRYSYVQNDPVNFLDPSGLFMTPTCLVDGAEMPCGLAFAIGRGSGIFGPANTTRWDRSAHMGAGEWQFYRSIAGLGSGWFNLAGVAINIHSWVGGEYAGGASYYDNFGTYSFGGNPFIQIDPGGPGPGATRPENQGPRNPRTGPSQPDSTAPCSHSGGGQGDVNVGIQSIGVGYTGGLQVTANRIHPYVGMSVGAGIPTVGGSIMVRNGTDISTGLNYTFSAGSVIGLQYSGHLDINNIRSSLRNGNFSFGGTTPNISASVTYVGQGRQIPCL